MKAGKKGSADEKLVLIPLKAACKDTTEVLSLVEKIFRDIAAGKSLEDFSIAKEINAGTGSALSDAFILKPSLWGIGVDLKELLKTWRAQDA